MEEAAKGRKRTVAPLKLYGQEYTADTWAMAKMNMIIHDIEGEIEIGDTFKNPKFRNRQGKVFLVNASQIFEKGDPKNFIPDAGIQRIAGTRIGWKEEEKLSRIVDHAELKKNDYNIFPSHYTPTSDAETYRSIAGIVEELNVIEAEARVTDKALRKILKQLSVAQ